MIDSYAVGQRLKSLRLHETQQELADRLGVARTTLARYEVGDRTPDAEFLLKAFYICQVDPLWLLTGQAQSVARLSADEQVLITNYRMLNQDLRNATLRVALGGVLSPQMTSAPLNQGVVVSGNNNSGIAGRDYFEINRKKNDDGSN